MHISANEIIDFWYCDRIKKQWFSATPELDQEILEKYGDLWETALAGGLDDWLSEPNGCLALIIVLDQFPLNMFRGTAKSFQSENKSIEVAKAAVSQRFEQQLGKDKLAFLFMPFMHSENILDQELSVSLFKKHGLQGNLRFAEHHREIIRKYGRFPHRNSILGRDSTDEEIKYLESNEAFKG
jgi:uncharacterized protein (DUF924 family)